MRARSADDVVLIDAVATDADGADENAVAIKRKDAWENHDPVRQIQPDAVSKWGRTKISGGGECDIGLGAGKIGNLILFGKKRPCLLPSIPGG